MMINLLKSKIHRATITNKNINYEGSITIDRAICEKANILEFEKVDVYNISNGKRFSTYVIFGKDGAIELNGAAARLGEIGDKIIIVSYAMFDTNEAKFHKPKIVILGEMNKIKEEING